MAACQLGRRTRSPRDCALAYEEWNTTSGSCISGGAIAAATSCPDTGGYSKCDALHSAQYHLAPFVSTLPHPHSCQNMPDAVFQNV